MTKLSFVIWKVGVWLYFFLIIFEGALRKWFLPSLSTPLLIIRDPIAFWVVITALNKKILRFNIYIVAIIIISIISFFNRGLPWDHGNVAVALYGLRILGNSLSFYVCDRRYFYSR